MTYLIQDLPRGIKEHHDDAIDRKEMQIWKTLRNPILYKHFFLCTKWLYWFINYSN